MIPIAKTFLITKPATKATLLDNLCRLLSTLSPAPTVSASTVT